MEESNVKPYIHLFNTAKNFYFYDVNTNLIGKISEESYNILQKGMGFNSELYAYKKRGLLSNKKVKIIFNPISHYVEFILKEHLNHIVLQLTQQCNMRCNYCLYSGSYRGMRLHSDKNMNIDILEQSLSFLINHSMQSMDLNIGFYGGEPLIRFDLIEYTFQYMKKHCPTREINYSMTTNATLLTPAKVDILVKENIKIKISIDGPESVHNSNRTFINGKGSYRRIIKNLEYIYNHYPEFYRNNISFNAVFDGSVIYNDVLNFFLSNNLFHNNRIKISYVNTFFENNLDSHKSIETQRNLSYAKNAVLYYFNNLKGRKIKNNEVLDQLFSFQELEDKLENQFCELPDVYIHAGLCIPGVSRLFINTEGEFYLCEKVAEGKNSHYLIGDIYKGFNIRNVKRLLNGGNINRKDCLNCWAIRLCDICAAKIDLNSVKSKDRLTTKCNFLRNRIDKQLKDYCFFLELKENFKEDKDYYEFVSDN